MRIRRSLTATTAFTSSDPDQNLFRTPRRCSSIADNNNTTNKTSSIIVCVLNQSPWDVADLASCQLDGGLFSLTGTSPAPDLATGSQSLGSSVKLCGETTKRPLAATDKCSDRGDKTKSAGLSPPEVKIRAEKSSTSGTGDKAVSLNRPQIRASSVKKQQRELSDSNPKPEIKKRGRPVKRSAANPNEFYYYSGFGPHWGKKRETVTKSPVVAPNKSVVTDKELRKNEGSTKRDIEFVEYDEDDDDNVEENEEGTRRPGGRKRVKARSLKSLM